MKVIIFNDYAKVTGGQDQCAIAGAIGLARRKLDVTFCGAVGPVAEELSNESDLRTICLNLDDILGMKNRSGALLAGFHNFQAVNLVSELLRGYDPAETILHFHSYTKALSPGLIDYVLKKKYKVIMTLNDYFIECPNGAFFIFPEEKICSFRPLSMPCITCNCDSRNYGHKLWRVARTAYQNKILKLDGRIKKYISVSEFCANILRPHFPDNRNIDFLFNPIDLPDEGPAEVKANSSFLFVGRFVRTKGVHLFAEAVRKLNLNAVFIGDGPLKEHLQNICPDAEFTGWLGSAEVRKKIRSSRCLVFPSMWYEAQPLTPAEALAQGVPVVTSDCNAAVDYVHDLVNGLHFKNGDLDSLCSKLELMKSEELAGQLGQEAHKRYWENPWTLERHVDKLASIYQNIMQTAD